MPTNARRADADSRDGPREDIPDTPRPRARAVRLAFQRARATSACGWGATATDASKDARPLLDAPRMPSQTGHRVYGTQRHPGRSARLSIQEEQKSCA